jgi:hypothetical protein
VSDDRALLLRRYGRLYGELGLAIAWTDTNRARNPEDDRPKRVTTEGWQHTTPLVSGDLGETIFGQGTAKNPAVVLRPSGLVGIDCDTEGGLARIAALGLPETVTVCSSKPYKRHYWWRPPPELEQLPFVAFRFEDAGLGADAGRYFLVPPAFHPSGATYRFLDGHAPDEIEIAEMPIEVYRRLVDEHDRKESAEREKLQVDPDAKVREGQRRETVFRFASMLRRWTADEDAIAEAAMRWNESHCEPVLSRAQVELQVRGAMKKQGEQELARAAEDAPDGFALDAVPAPRVMELPDPLAEGMLLGPLVVRPARTVIVGDTGHGKTALAAQFVRAVLAGDECLGYRGARLGPAMIVDLEQGLRSVKRTLREAGLDERDDLLYVHVPDGLRLERPDEPHFAALARLIDEHRPVVVALDPFYKAHGGDANEERAVVDLMRALDALRTRYEFALLLPAHPRKDPASSPARKLTLHDVAGSGAIVRGAELVLAIERLSHGYARLRILKDRDGDLEVGAAWPLLFTRGEGFRLDPKEERTAEELEARVLATAPEWQTVQEWAADLGIRKASAKDLLEKLVESGRVEAAVGPPGRSRQAHCYSTSPAPWVQSGPVTPSLLDTDTGPTGPTSIEDVDSGTSRTSVPGPGPVDVNPLLDDQPQNDLGQTDEAAGRRTS